MFETGNELVEEPKGAAAPRTMTSPTSLAMVIAGILCVVIFRKPSPRESAHAIPLLHNGACPHGWDSQRQLLSAQLRN
jgi:hypothetical protein